MIPAGSKIAISFSEIFFGEASSFLSINRHTSFVLDYVGFFSWNEGAFVFLHFFHLLSTSFPVFFQAGIENSSSISH